MRNSVDPPALVKQPVSEVPDTFQQEAQVERPRPWQTVTVRFSVVSWVKTVQWNDVFRMSLSPVEKLQV